MHKPAVSLVLSAVTATLASPVAFAAAAPAADALVACAQIPESSARLACFDREVAPLVRPRAAAGAPVTPAPAIAATPPARPSAPVAPAPAPPTVAATPSFGEEQLSLKHRKEPATPEQSLQASIAALRQVSATQFLVTLDNGQVWRHDDATQGAYLRVGEAITIRKGTMGSYRLTRDAGASRNWIRVTRVR